MWLRHGYWEVDGTINKDGEQTKTIDLIMTPSPKKKKKHTRKLHEMKLHEMKLHEIKLHEMEITTTNNSLPFDPTLDSTLDPHLIHTGMEASMKA